MIKILLISAFLFFAFNGTAQHAQHLKQQKITDDLYYTEVEERVYMITHYFPFWGGNSMFILLEDKQAVLIDTPYELTGTQALMNWIDENFDKLNITAIITGFHQDNLGGAEVLYSRDIPVYGPELTATLVKEQGPELIALMMNSLKDNENPKYYEGYRNLTLLPPDHTFPIEEGLTLDIGGESFEVYFPGESHTVDNTIVYLRNKNILFGGCMFKGLMYQNPGYMGYANMEAWPVSVEKVIDTFPDTRVAIPGAWKHGGPKSWITP